MTPGPTAWRSGTAAMLPIALAALPFGMLFGAEATRQGLAPAETLLMSLTVFAGGSQFLAMGLWADPAPWVTLALATLLVNLRHTLMSASLSGKLGAFPPWTKALAAFLLADETWALAERRALDGRLTPSWYFGCALTLYALWAAGSLTGALLGGLITSPERWGLDFAFPAIFIVLIMGFAKSWSALPVVAVAAAVAWWAERAIGGSWFILLGGLAGIAVAALMPERAAP
jgi:4-azaleucine resistance transporter AzlC